MELSDKRQGRARRANAGNRLQELLEQGLDNEEEEILKQLDEDSSDSSFTASSSDSDAADEFDSDFSDEEEEGVLDGEEVETEATARRAERKEKQVAKKRNMQRMHNFAYSSRAAKRLESRRQRELQQRKQRGSASKAAKTPRTTRSSRGPVDAENDASGAGEHSEGGEGDASVHVDLRQTVRKRKAPTIPLHERMQAALARAHDVRLQQQQQQQEGTDRGSSSGQMNLLTSLQLQHQQQRTGGRRPRATSRMVAAHAAGSSSAFGWLTASGPAWTDTGRRVSEAEGADPNDFQFIAPGLSVSEAAAALAHLRDRSRVASTTATSALAEAPRFTEVGRPFSDRNRRMWLYAGSVKEPRRGQRVRYHSSARVRTETGSDVVYGFSADLPVALGQSAPNDK